MDWMHSERARGGSKLNHNYHKFTIVRNFGSDFERCTETGLIATKCEVRALSVIIVITFLQIVCLENEQI